MSKPKILCYSRHWPVLEKFCRDMGIPRSSTRTISSHRDLYGLRNSGFYFFKVYDHPDPIPLEINTMIEEQGLEVIIHDDSPRRRAYYNEQEKRNKK